MYRDQKAMQVFRGGPPGVPSTFAIRPHGKREVRETVRTAEVLARFIALEALQLFVIVMMPRSLNWVLLLHLPIFCAFVIATLEWLHVPRLITLGAFSWLPFLTAERLASRQPGPPFDTWIMVTCAGLLLWVCIARSHVGPLRSFDLSSWFGRFLILGILRYLDPTIYASAYYVAAVVALTLLLAFGLALVQTLAGFHASGPYTPSRSSFRLLEIAQSPTLLAWRYFPTGTVVATALGCSVPVMVLLWLATGQRSWMWGFAANSFREHVGSGCTSIAFTHTFALWVFLLSTPILLFSRIASAKVGTGISHAVSLWLGESHPTPQAPGVHTSARLDFRGLPLRRALFDFVLCGVMVIVAGAFPDGFQGLADAIEADKSTIGTAIIVGSVVIASPILAWSILFCALAPLWAHVGRLADGTIQPRLSAEVAPTPEPRDQECDPPI